MLKEIRTAVVLLVALAAITGLLYPAVVTGLAQALFPTEANGSLVEKDGQVIGSALIGQTFASDRYFHGRPSATGPEPYNAAASSGSNLGPTSKALADRLAAGVAALKAENPNAAVPVDLVTTSGSGLDPDITPEAALFQVPRIAAARNLPADDVRRLVEAHTVDRPLGLLGEPRVNVLALNMALDQAGK